MPYRLSRAHIHLQNDGPFAHQVQEYIMNDRRPNASQTDAVRFLKSGILVNFLSLLSREELAKKKKKQRGPVRSVTVGRMSTTFSTGHFHRRGKREIGEPTENAEKVTVSHPHLSASSLQWLLHPSVSQTLIFTSDSMAVMRFLFFLFLYITYVSRLRKFFCQTRRERT